MVFEAYRISSPYGWRRDPFGGGQSFHAGIDLVKSHQAPISTFTEGTVLFAGVGQKGTGLNGYGNVVVIKDKNNRVQLYAHLDRIAVKTGTTVKRNQLIGYQGATGNVTGSHLHYEVRKKTSPLYGWEADASKSTLNPTSYLQSFYPTTVPSTPSSNSGTYVVNKTLDGYVTAQDAKLRRNKKTTVNPGNYYIYNTADGMINVTTRQGSPGSWINPNDNTTQSTSDTYVVNKTLNGYLTAADAKARINKKTTVSPGRYFIFRKVDGMINVTTRQGVPGSWINPNDNTTQSTSNTYVVNRTVNGYFTAADAKSRNTKRTTVEPGQYFIFNEADGMINVTVRRGSPGSWINPGDNA